VPEQVQRNLDALMREGLLKTYERDDGIFYRVKLAPKSGR